MTISKPNWFALAAMAALLLTGLTVQAQDTNTTAAGKQSAGTNQVLEDTNPTTNAPPSESTGVHQDALVRIRKDVELKAGDTADGVVVVFGSAKIHGHAHDVVAVFGNITVDGEVDGDTVAVGGGIKVEPTGVLHHDAVAVGGKVDVDKGGKVEGRIEDIDLGGLEFHLDWLQKWLMQCVFKLRPLAPQVGWVWAVAGIFFLMYLVVAALFPTPVRACVQELTERPATTFLIGLLSKILLPLVFFLLAITGIGLLVVPFLGIAMIIGLIVGKTAILEALGLRIGQQFGLQALQKPLAALLMGAIIIAIFYMVPILGLLTFGIVSIWGLGGAVRATFVGMRRETPEKKTRLSQPVAQPAMAMAGAPQPSSLSTAPGEAPHPEPFVPSPSPLAPESAAAAAPPFIPEVLSRPKAGFWERMAAGFLDLVLIGIVGGIIGKGPPLPFLIALAYFSAMWTWKGTTVGGIVLSLKVVREDGQPLSFLASLIRALAAAFSIVMFFLGFLWIAWDRDKQGWHDKIAGTVVLRLPRGTPLVCI